MTNHPDFGYAFEPDCSPDAPAHSRLRVVLRARPTHAHYDPEHVTLPVVTRLGEIEPLRVFHPWPADHDYTAAAGRVILQDRVGKKVEAFTLGGRITLDAEPDYVVLQLDSPAPILALQFPASVSDHLAAAIEGLLAQRRAAHDMAGEPRQLEARLAALDPATLYQACLRSLADRLRAGYVAVGERALAPFVQHALLPGAPPLEDLL
ncbi:MAG: hypothetical protein IT317_03440 [Anaerolineales bacterium]|nr:hypothetical protein [Anaerolineales bacterium]